MILVTGGAGFIGTNFVLDWLANVGEPVINIDNLTDAGSHANLDRLRQDERHIFVHRDICDRELIASLLDKYQPRAVIHLAAETHVDQSIVNAAKFVRTNIDGTLSLLEVAKAFYGNGQNGRENFRFLHVSTDEVYGSLTYDDAPFTETTPYAPNNPYAATKAAADHLVRAFHHTHGLPTLTTHCSNNFGPFQFADKLIPLVIYRALAGKTVPIYGDGEHVRDWLFVADHCSALRAVLERGRPGESYNIGSRSEMGNLALVRALCDMLDVLAPKRDGGQYAEQIRLVADRPGHDRRYGVNPAKIERELAWRPSLDFASALQQTAQWYVERANVMGQDT